MKYLVMGPTVLDVQIPFQPSGQGISHQHIGGKGYNVAKDLRVLGADVSLSSVLGSDHIGDYLRSQLTHDEIDWSGSTETDQSMVYMEIIDQQAESLHRSFSTHLFSEEQLAQVDWPSIDVCLVISSAPEHILKSLTIKKEEYPELVLAVEFASRRDAQKILDTLGSSIDFLIGNQKEFEQGIMDVLDCSREQLHTELYQQYQIPVFVETQGGVGSLLTVEGVTISIPGNPLDPEQIVSTIGAGDSVTAGMLWARYTQQKTWQESLEFGMSLARQIIQQPEAYLVTPPKE